MAFYSNNRRKLLVLFILTAFTAGCRFYFKTTTDSFTATSSPASISNGKNLAFNICAGCHYDPAVKKFMGRRLNDLPKIAGQLYSANLTKSKTNGMMPEYTDAELFYLLKTGIGRTGKFMPYMMRPTMADADMYDIIAYFRSGDEAVQPADTTVGKTHINFIGKNGIRFVTHPQPYQKGVARPDEHDPIAYGRYLVGITGCYHCHSQKVLGLDYEDPEHSKGYLTGGIKLKDPEGKRLFGPNLRFDKETGIGNYSKEDFRTAVRNGVSPSDKKLSPPMDKFEAMTDQQVDAIYAYLKSLAPVRHVVRK